VRAHASPLAAMRCAETARLPAPAQAGCPDDALACFLPRMQDKPDLWGTPRGGLSPSRGAVAPARLDGERPLLSAWGIIQARWSESERTLMELGWRTEV